MAKRAQAATRGRPKATKVKSGKAGARKTKPTKAKQRPVSLSELTADGKNPRKIRDEAFEGLGLSMAEFGDLSGITFNLRFNELVAGHQRIKRLTDQFGSDLKIKKLDAERGLIETPAGSTFPVRFVDWTRARQQAANVAANAPTIQGEFTDDLQLLLAEIKDETPDIFEGLMLDVLLLPEVLGEDENVEPETDRADELEKKWGTAIGQVWEIKGEKKTHRLACGDSTDAAVVERLLNGAKPFLMVTDPPYGVDYSPEWRREVDPRWNYREGNVDNDDRADWLEAYKLFTGQVAYVWHAGIHATTVAQDLVEAGFEMRGQIIWRKPSLVMGRSHYHWQHEPLWYAVRKKGSASAKWQGGRKQATIWDIETLHPTQGTTDDGVTDHGTQKPLECMARPMRNHGKAADSVYDPFLGSGTSMLAADRLGRQLFGCELNPKYVGIILERMEAAGCQCKQITK